MSNSSGVRLPMTTKEQTQIAAVIERSSLSHNALFLLPGNPTGGDTTGRFGGMPSLAAKNDWPVSAQTGEKLPFLFEIDLSSEVFRAHPTLSDSALTGILSVFAQLTFNFDFSAQKNPDGLITDLIHLRHTTGERCENIQINPGDMTSPFDDDLGFVDLEEGFQSPDGLQLPSVPMCAISAWQLDPEPPAELFGERNDLFEKYLLLAPLVNANEFNSAFDAAGIRAPGGAKTYFPERVVKMFGPKTPHINRQTGSTNDHTILRLFQMPLPPLSGVRDGDPYVDVQLTMNEWRGASFENVQAFLLTS